MKLPKDKQFMAGKTCEYGLSPGDSLNEDFILPHYHQRTFAHNYHAPFIYHVILKKKVGFPAFGTVKGNARIAPGTSGCAYIEETALGHIIAGQIRAIQAQFPILQVYQFFLLRNPDKVAVRISRNFADEELAAKRTAWLHAAANGGVLVSPFVSAEEKAVRKEAEAVGAKVIRIVHECMGERYKPGARDFALCEQGRLLIVSAGFQHGAALTRDVCMRMNSIAAAIAAV